MANAVKWELSWHFVWHLSARDHLETLKFRWLSSAIWMCQVHDNFALTGLCRTLTIYGFLLFNGIIAVPIMHEDLEQSLRLTKLCMRLQFKFGCFLSFTFVWFRWIHFSNNLWCQNKCRLDFFSNIHFSLVQTSIFGICHLSSFELENRKKEINVQLHFIIWWKCHNFLKQTN